MSQLWVQQSKWVHPRTTRSECSEEEGIKIYIFTSGISEQLFLYSSSSVLCAMGSFSHFLVCGAAFDLQLDFTVGPNITNDHKIHSLSHKSFESVRIQVKVI